MNTILEAITFTSPWIVAHRGFQKKYPENTLVAFQAAMDAGVPMIELDVTLCRDRKPVVIHDATLERTTNGQVKMVHEAGLRVFPYGVDNPKEYARMLDMKVDGVITGDPLLAADWFGHKKAA